MRQRSLLACCLVLSLFTFSCQNVESKEKTDPKEELNNPVYNIIGQWQNSYGSVMTIQSQQPNGQFFGTYASSTGSTGNYYVIGYTPVANSANRPLSLTIYWRSISGGTGDPTWHWVSTMNGLIKTDPTYGNITSIKLLHDMIASTPFAAVDVLMPGHYTETLNFVPTSNAGTPPPVSLPSPTNNIGPISGNWKNVNPSSTFQNLTLQLYDNWSVTGGQFGQSIQSGVPVIGVYDENAIQGDIVSLSLSGMFTDPLNQSVTMSFGGLYQPSTGLLTITPMMGRGVSTASDFSAVNVLPTEVFVKN